MGKYHIFTFNKRIVIILIDSIIMKTWGKKRSFKSEDEEDDKKSQDEDWKEESKTKDEGSEDDDDDDDNDDEWEGKRKRGPYQKHKNKKTKNKLPINTPKRASTLLITPVQKNRLPNLPRLPFTERLFSNNILSLKSRSPAHNVFNASEFLKSRGILSESSILINPLMDKRKKNESIEEVTLDDDDDADSAFESASDGSKDFEYDFDGLDPKKSQKVSISNESVKARVKTEKDTSEFPNNVREVYKNV